LPVPFTILRAEITDLPGDEGYGLIVADAYNPTPDGLCVPTGLHIIFN